MGGWAAWRWQAGCGKLASQSSSVRPFMFTQCSRSAFTFTVREHISLWMRFPATSPYNVNCAVKEFGFIDANFTPPGTQVDLEDCEGGSPDNELLPLINAEPSSSTNPPAAPPPTTPSQPLEDASNALRVKFSLPSIVSAVGRVIHGAGFKLHIAPT